MVEIEYAKAIFELAVEEKKEDSISECFNVVIETIKDEDFLKVMTSPFIDVVKQKDLLKKVYASLDETFLNFLCVLVDHHRFAMVNEISHQYGKLVLKKNNIVKVKIVSAQELTSHQKEQYMNTLKMQYVGKKIKLVNIVNPDLIGGVLVLANGEAIDMSLKNTIGKMKESL